MDQPTQCTYEKTAHGRCFRPTMRSDGRCYYHTSEALAKRKPKRRTRKALEAIAKAAETLEAAIAKREAIQGTHPEFCDCAECEAVGHLRGLLFGDR